MSDPTPIFPPRPQFFIADVGSGPAKFKVAVRMPEPVAAQITRMEDRIRELEDALRRIRTLHVGDSHPHAVTTLAIIDGQLEDQHERAD